MHHPTDRITHITAFVTPVVEHWLEREIENSYNNTVTKVSEVRVLHQTSSLGGWRVGGGQS